MPLLTASAHNSKAFPAKKEKRERKSKIERMHSENKSGGKNMSLITPVISFYCGDGRRLEKALGSQGGQGSEKATFILVRFDKAWKLLSLASTSRDKPVCLGDSDRLGSAERCLV